MISFRQYLDVKLMRTVVVTQVPHPSQLPQHDTGR
jgi:hypothetical protein